MSGSIIPTPLAMPTTCASPAVASATFATVSVVMIALAASVSVAPEASGQRSASR